MPAYMHLFYYVCVCVCVLAYIYIYYCTYDTSPLVAMSMKTRTNDSERDCSNLGYFST